VSTFLSLSFGGGVADMDVYWPFFDREQMEREKCKNCAKSGPVVLVDDDDVV
jgi:hypothetical protein